MTYRVLILDPPDEAWIVNVLTETTEYHFECNVCDVIEMNVFLLAIYKQWESKCDRVVFHDWARTKGRHFFDWAKEEIHDVDVIHYRKQEGRNVLISLACAAPLPDETF
jgi:hypothetical protein